MLENIKRLFKLQNVLSQELVEYIIIYLRKSRKDAEFGKDEPIEKTLERHEKILQDWAMNIFGCKIPEKNIYKEVVSGDTISDRPQMQKVLELIENDEIKGVLCVEIERLARGNSIDQGIIAQKFQLTGTKILTPTKIFDLDDEFDMSYFEEGLHQSRRFLLYTKKILSRGREQSSKEGKFVGSIAPFGYSKEKLKNEKGFILIKNDDNYIVRKLFDIYLYENLGTSNTAKKLNSLGLHCPSGGKWNGTMVRRILSRSEVYNGRILWNRRKTIKKYVNGNIKILRPINDDCINVIGKHESTISDKEYKMVKEKLKANSKKTVKANMEMKNPLMGLVKCYYCGASMSRRAYYMSYKKDGSIHKDTLLCRTSGCQNVSSDLDLVEKKVLEYIQNKLKNYEKQLNNYESNNIDLTKEYEKEKKLVLTKIENINVKKQKCCEFLENGTYDEETFKNRISVLNEELKIANNNLLVLNQKMKSEGKEKYKTAIPILKNCLILYNKSSVKGKNEMLSSIIDKIIYKKDSKGGRWNKESRASFDLEIKFKI